MRRDYGPGLYVCGHGTEPDSRDTDGDGVGDGVEVARGTDPLAAEARSGNIDADGDDDLIWFNGADHSVKVHELEHSASQGAATPLIDPVEGNLSYALIGHGDFDGDADTDYLWQRASDGDLVISVMQDGVEQFQSSLGVFNTAYALVGTGDTDADGDDDLVWYRTQAPAAGRVTIFEIEANAKVAQNWVGDFANTDFRPFALGDVDKDGDDDLYWYRVYDPAGTSDDRVDINYWSFEGSQRAEAGTGGAWLNAYDNLTYRPEAVGDFDGDGDDDVVWRNQVDGNVVAWEIEDADGAHTGTKAQRVSNVWVGQFLNTEWVIVDSGDTNGDGIEDLIWYRAASGAVNIWEISALTQSQILSVLPASNTAYQLVPKHREP
ncbi:MAG: hypothetical protein MJE66_00835 [Proteobacteria bacterium]|nr:hypothetical protein [Pseudomonadota bacterium]